MMPKMDGIETLAKIKEENLKPDKTTMIALTANAVVGAKETYLKAGFDDYLSKPIEVEKLEEKLEKYLPEDIVSRMAKGVENAAEEEKAGIATKTAPDEKVPKTFPKDDEDVMEFAPQDMDEVMEFESGEVEASGNEDEEFITKNHDRLLAGYKEITDKIAVVLKQDK